MKTILNLLKEEVTAAFVEAGYDAKYGMVSLSNRPDLCQYQCNGAMAAAKAYKKAPIMIANDVVAILEKSETFKDISAINPGFINMNLSNAFVANYVDEMRTTDSFGYNKVEEPFNVIVDYGGPNVAKPLHVGHLRAAVIGESVKRICKFVGHNAIGDIHLGDWGLQMGLIITELKKRQPELPYFDENFTGEYPEEAPFTIAELEEIYPYASAFSKKNPDYLEEARNATYRLQKGEGGYAALWKHIRNVSIADLKQNYDKLNVHFELWKGESDAEPQIPGMVEYLKENGYAYYSEGALVVDVKEETDKKEIPPCMILKADGSALYNTTDLGTIVEREKLYQPKMYKYVVDKRQDLYFEQVFRCARKAKMVGEDVDLTFLGFGTMNGKDGKPFKTRDGGVMRLEYLIGDVTNNVYDKMKENRGEIPEEEARDTAQKIAVAAIKYGDLSNQPSKDYVFDLDRFTAFEGNTGPYILYTIVRIKSILNKYKELHGDVNVADIKLLPASTDSETGLMLELTKFSDMIDVAFKENAPNKVCQFVYDLANAFNRFYHENKIIAEEDAAKQASWIALISYTLDMLNQCIDLLAIEAPDRM